MIASYRALTRKLFMRTQDWGKSKNCLRDLTILTFISSTIIPFPVEAFLIAIVAADPKRWLRAATAITLGSVLGALICYLAGYLLQKNAIALVHHFNPGIDWLEIKSKINKEGAIFLAVAAFAPGLFRIGMVGAGVLSFNPLIFVIAVASGRGIRFLLEAGLLRIFGARLRTFLENYFDLVTLALGAAAIVLLIVFKFANHH